MERIDHEVGSGNVFADLGFARPMEAQAKAELARRIAGIIERRHLDRSEAAELLGVQQSVVSRMLRGQLSAFPMEALLLFMLKLDQDIEIRCKARRDAAEPPTIVVVAQ